MTHGEKRIYLIEKLLKEQPQYVAAAIPDGEEEQKRLLRSLMNVRMPRKTSDEFLAVQNEYLRAETEAKGITRTEDLKFSSEGFCVWQGDITTLAADAIVNAANSALLGCFYPCHSCIDNCIHTYAGVQLRAACAEIMARQGREEETGKAKITSAFNLPSKYVIHTVGPIIYSFPAKEDDELLSSCYRSCLETAEENGCGNIAFCCISTGEFRFPNRRAAEIAVSTVRDYKKERKSDIEVIFNVFKDTDYKIYKELLG